MERGGSEIDHGGSSVDLEAFCCPDEGAHHAAEAARKRRASVVMARRQHRTPFAKLVCLPCDVSICVVKTFDRGLRLVMWVATWPCRWCYRGCKEMCLAYCAQCFCLFTACLCPCITTAKVAINMMRCAAFTVLCGCLWRIHIRWPPMRHEDGIQADAARQICAEEAAVSSSARDER